MRQSVGRASQDVAVVTNRRPAGDADPEPVPAEPTVRTAQMLDRSVGSTAFRNTRAGRSRSPALTLWNRIAVRALSWSLASGHSSTGLTSECPFWAATGGVSQVPDTEMRTLTPECRLLLLDRKDVHLLHGVVRAVCRAEKHGDSPVLARGQARASSGRCPRPCRCARGELPSDAPRSGRTRIRPGARPSPLIVCGRETARRPVACGGRFAA